MANDLIWVARRRNAFIPESRAKVFEVSAVCIIGGRI